MVRRFLQFRWCGLKCGVGSAEVKLSTYIETTWPTLPIPVQSPENAWLLRRPVCCCCVRSG